MRAVGIRASLLASLGALVVLALDCKEARAEPVSAARADTADYYTRRARTILDREKARLAKPHPLAAAHPDQDIVVCEAGCADGSGALVVFSRERPVATEERQAIMVPTSASLSDASQAASITCIAGCYGEKAAVYAAPSPRAKVEVERMDPPVRDALSPVR
ncbi:hypothetical protein [Hyphomicrobium sp. CS1GBMeth3]|uniref:hypothetical protein n=1 Tax=Hyphomicrobium sp. CS1GBMeth3 TaxID=1892845 RepID=UPI0009318364|nr:hypothetical protein [Hyphomicrobium sp. CS1GBMeth3]